MKVGVKILPKNEVLDSQGRAVENTLRHNGRTGVTCRVGRYVQLDIDTGDADEARAKAQDVAEFVLHNPLIETYQIELLDLGTS